MPETKGRLHLQLRGWGKPGVFVRPICRLGSLVVSRPCDSGHGMASDFLHWAPPFLESNNVAALCCFLALL